MQNSTYIIDIDFTADPKRIEKMNNDKLYLIISSHYN